MKRFDIITEADARTIDVGATVELAPGGHVTPLARDTLAARRVTIVSAGVLDSSLASGLVPAAEIKRVYSAKIAQEEILHRSKLATVWEPEERQKLDEGYRRDVQRLHEERDSKIEKVRHAR